MNNLSANKIKKIEFYSIFANNIFLLLGILCFGWTLFETLFLYWLELIAAIIVLIYVQVICPLKYGRPGQIHLPEYRKTAGIILCASFYVLAMHYIVLLYLIDLGALENWDCTQGVWYTLIQLPGQLWNGNLLLLTLLFLMVYLLPTIMNERRGIRPSMENQPIQSKIMTHKSQFVVSYLLFGGLWLMTELFNINQPMVLIATLMILKSAYEAILFSRLD